MRMLTLLALLSLQAGLARGSLAFHLCAKIHSTPLRPCSLSTRPACPAAGHLARLGVRTAPQLNPLQALSPQGGMSESAKTTEEAVATRRAAYLRQRDARERQLLPQQVNMEGMFGEDPDACPEYIARWGGMHRQVAMEGPTRKALEMAVDSEWCVDGWNTETPAVTEGEVTVTRS